MDAMLPVAIIAVGVCLMVLIGVLGYLAAKRRREQFAAFAASRGWTYVQRDDRWAHRFQGHPFGTGDDRRADNIVTGEYDGRTFEAFDYSYTTTSTSTDANGHTTTHRETHSFSVLALETRVALPRLEVTPEHWFGRVVGRLTNRDIELESEDFNRAFRVSADDPKFASDVLNPRTMQQLLGRPHLSWRIEGTDILCWQNGEQHPAGVTAAVETMLDVLKGIPSFVWHDNGYDAGSTAVGGTS